MRSIARFLGALSGLCALIWVQGSPLHAQTKGIVMNNGSKRAVVFDADTDAVLGSVGVGSSAVGDCSVTGNQKLGFGTAFDNRVYPIDLDTLTPAGPPIPIVNFGEDTSITPDQKFMAVCNGSAPAPVSVIDIGTQTQISTFNLGHDCNSVEVCSDGSVLVSSFNTGRVRRLTIDGAGQLSDTGEVLNVSRPMNVVCGAGAASGVAITVDPGRLQSFTIPGLAPVHTRTLGGDGMSLEINSAGDRVYARKNSPGAIQVFDYDSATGALSAAPLLTWGIASASTFFGMDQLALHPSGQKLYVSEPAALKVFDPSTGALMTSIIHLDISEATGVCFASNRPPEADAGPDQTVECTGATTSVTLDASGSTDLDGDALTYEWYDGPTLIATGAMATLDLPLGTHVFTLKVNDGKGGTDEDEVVVDVVDTTAPTISLLGPDPQIVECSATFIDPGATALDACAGDLTSAIAAASTVDTSVPGTYSVTYSVADPSGNSASASRAVIVADATTPVITGLAVDKAMLWPPNHKMVDVKAVYATSDVCIGAVTTSLSVSSNEPVDGTGDGDTSPDWVVVDNHSVKLRAERAGTGTGRMYTITVTATDATGNSSRESITVVVPHNQ